MRITPEVLKKLGACSRQRKRFNWLWPKGLVLNTANLNRAKDLDLHTRWFIFNILYIKERAELNRRYYRSSNPGTYNKIAIEILKEREAHA